MTWTIIVIIVAVIYLAICFHSLGVFDMSKKMEGDLFDERDD